MIDLAHCRALDARDPLRRMRERFARPVEDTVYLDGNSIGAMPADAPERVQRLMTEGWRAGKFDLFRLLQTSRDAAEARRLYLETLGLLWDSTIALDRAVGAL